MLCLFEPFVPIRIPIMWYDDCQFKSIEYSNLFEMSTTNFKSQSVKKTTYKCVFVFSLILWIETMTMKFQFVWYTLWFIILTCI